MRPHTHTSLYLATALALAVLAVLVWAVVAHGQDVCVRMTENGPCIGEPYTPTDTPTVTPTETATDTPTETPTATATATTRIVECPNPGAVVWEQELEDVVEWWQLIVAATPQPVWPQGECTPLPSPTEGATGQLWSHELIPLPVDPFVLIACNSEGCSPPSDTLQCASPTPTITATPTETPTGTPTETPTATPTNTRKPLPHRPVWMTWYWR